MDNSIAKALEIKQKELASLSERVKSERSRLEHELATIDERTKEQRAALEEEIVILSRAANIAAATVSAPESKARRALTKQEREDLFQKRAALMRRLLERESGKEVHVRELARELDRPISTVKDYYNDQPTIRPAECFWTNGRDSSHFQWKDPGIASTAPSSHHSRPEKHSVAS